MHDSARSLVCCETGVPLTRCASVICDQGSPPHKIKAMQPPQADWYPDPEMPTQWRYWNGTEWTEQVHKASPDDSTVAPTLGLTKLGMILGVLAIVVLAGASMISPDLNLQGPPGAASGSLSAVSLRVIPLALGFWLAIFGLGTSWFGYRRYNDVNPRPRATQIAILVNAAALVLSIALPIA